MLIEGSLKSGKTSFIADKFVELILSGVSSSKILVLCENSHKKDLLISIIKDKLAAKNINGLGHIPVSTFSGTVRFAIANNWPIVEKMLSKENDNSVIIPHMPGLEITQYILKEIIKNADFSDYFSKTNLLHQLFRRYKLITENCLDNAEVDFRSAMLEETFAGSAKNALKELRILTQKYRIFDNLKQINTFLFLLNQGLINDYDEVKYFFVDDIDEMTYSGISFVKYMISKCPNYYLAADPQGTSRRGYLCGYTAGWEELKLLTGKKPTFLKTNSAMKDDADAIFKNIKFDEANRVSKILHFTEIKRAEMLDKALLKIKELIDGGIQAEDIKIVCPVIDEGIKFNLMEFFNQNHIKYNFLSGNSKYYDDLPLFTSFIILQLVNQDWQMKPSVFEIRLLLNSFLQIPVRSCKNILNAYTKTGKLPDEFCLSDKKSQNTYENLLLLINKLSLEKNDTYTQMTEIFSKIILPLVNENSNLEKFNMAIKSLQDFQKLKTTLVQNGNDFLKDQDWLIQLKNSVTSDNPAGSPLLEEKSIVIATPQKVVDLELTSKYQIWLDTSSRDWAKDDTGTLYNCWVFQKDWIEKTYTPETHRKLTEEKTAHLLRKLILCADKNIFAFSSVLDSSGNENDGFLNRFLYTQERKDKTAFQIKPRDDQKPVLEYKSGKMAVPAVPGAGKTTIMQALIIKLIEKVNPGKILVLTYMESATRNFIERIKKSCPNLSEFPHISTIHGLAFKIIQDEDNFAKLGLSNDFSICDESLRNALLRSICLNHLPSGEEAEDWIKLNTKAVSKAKMSSLGWKAVEKACKTSKTNILKEFLVVYKEYETVLREKNLIDYDDLLVLSVRLLEEYQQIREYYQNRYDFVIEDEAQDSSEIQQRLINLISQKSGNLIRCGDINQAIMTTFTDADVRGFKEFIDKNPCVEMKSSQRCAKEIYELANYLVDWSKQNATTKNAFYDIKMTPAEGKNPVSPNALHFHQLKTPDEEKELVLNEIKKQFDKNGKQTVGILLRTNSQVFQWADFIEKNGFKVICRAESIKRKKVFRFILKLLEVIESPWNNKIVSEFMMLYAELGFLKITPEIIKFVSKTMKNSFIEINTNEVDEINTPQTNQFWWDVHYWIENSSVPPEELVIKIGNYYFEDVLDISNANLLSVIIKKYINSFTSQESHSSIRLPDIVNYLKTLLNQDKIRGIKFFTEEDNADNSLDGFVQIMTLHKSKGDEFDIVFVPEMTEYMFTLDYKTLNKKKQQRNENDLLKQLETISGLKPKSLHEEILLEMEETLRVIYVGTTRAKKHLYMSSPEKMYTKSASLFDAKPSTLLVHLISKYKSGDVINA
jgi:DNA helicase-2/ATP-dependent DNA helicase PcrA